LPKELKPLTKLTFDFHLISLGILVANTFACYAAGELVQFKRQRQALFTSHPLITSDLLLQCVLWLHVR
jgi:hypothetical protein